MSWGGRRYIPTTWTRPSPPRGSGSGRRTGEWAGVGGYLPTTGAGADLGPDGPGCGETGRGPATRNESTAIYSLRFIHMSESEIFL